MTRGFLLFAHNNGVVDYVKLARICANRIKKILHKSVTLVTDKPVEYPEFDNVVITEIDKTNKRNINNIVQPFYNISRLDSYKLSPYDETMVIDVDYIVNSDLLNQYFGSKESFLIGEGVNNIHNFEYDGVQMFGMDMKWATTLYFKKDKVAEAIFDQAKFVKENYEFYKRLYQFNPSNYRNDYAFTIAEHIIKGLTKSNSLPKINFLCNYDDEILDVKGKKFVCSVNKQVQMFNGVDLHFFNKETILDHEEQLLC
jgi:hypothetical protein